MIIDFAELDRMLETFTAPEDMPAVEGTRQLAQQKGAVITKSDSAGPTHELLTIYRGRARNPRLSPAAARERAQLASLAERCLDERWHIYIVKIDHQKTGPSAECSQTKLGSVAFASTPR